LNVFRSVALAALLGLPLVVVPSWEQPFSRPKLQLWAFIVVAGLLACARRVRAAWKDLPQRIRIALSLWLAALGASALWGEFASLESLTLPLAGVGWLAVVLALRPSAERASWFLVASGAAVGAIALAQVLHADPFAALRWVSATPGNSRMRAFATLGNPNFVAAFLTGMLPLTFGLASESRRWRWLLASLCVLQAAAICATGSRAPIAGLAAAMLWMIWVRSRRLLRAFSAATLCISALVAFASPARDLSTTLRGRIYIWKVSAPRLREHFVFGLGPGGFAASFPAWETEYWRTVADDRDRGFAAIEDHMHNDYLEFLADYGAAGLLALLAVLATFLGTIADRKAGGDPSLLAGASAGVVALAVISLVDFPLMRPTETFLLWSLIAISLLSRRTSRADGLSADHSSALNCAMPL
jgi:O-antigen ligase